MLIMNEKYDVVARHHLSTTPANADRFRDCAVVTIEKNRNGVDKIDLEFRKRFEQGRFERRAASRSSSSTNASTSNNVGGGFVEILGVSTSQQRGVSTLRQSVSGSASASTIV